MNEAKIPQATECKQGEVSREYVRLSERTSELHGMIVSLAEKLKDALRPPEPQETCDSLKTKLQSPLAERLSNISISVEADIALVNDIHNRLEL